MKRSRNKSMNIRKESSSDFINQKWDSFKSRFESKEAK